MGAEHFVADVEVVVREAALLAGQDAMIGIFGGKLRHGHPKAWSLLHALENEVHAVGTLLHHAAQPRLNKVLFAHAFLGPLDRDVMIAGEGLDPVLVVGGPLAQQLLTHRRSADHLAKEEYDLLWA